VTGALVYLIVRSTRNRVVFRLRRLRQPRYAIASMAGALYFALMLRPGGDVSRAFSYGAASSAILEIAGSLTVFLTAALAWVFTRSGRPSLTFTRADVQWLFPAPLTRRQLIVYRMLSSQPALLVSSLILTAIIGRRTLADALIFFVGVWLLETTLSLHLSGVSLRRRSLGAHGFAGWSRQWMPLSVVTVASVVLVATVLGGWPHLWAAQSIQEGAEVLQRLFSSGAAAMVLWPSAALVRVAMAPSGAAFATALPWALLLLALNLVWVVRSDAAFEEASAENAEKVAQTLAAMRGRGLVVGQPKRRPAPFTLSPTGRVEVAFLWKNLILHSRQSRWMLVLALMPAVTVGVVAAMDERSKIFDMVAMACVGISIMLLFMGPLALRNDLRQDLIYVATLKAWPVRGAALVRGEILAPALVLSGYAAVLLVVAAMLARRESIDLLVGPDASRIAWAAAAILVASGFAVTQLVVQNGFALVFPAWGTHGDARPGVEMMGQNMLVMVGSMLAVLLALIPPLVIGGMAAFALHLAIGTGAVVLAVAVGALVLFAECEIAVQILGRVFERTDLTAVARSD
jgi:ABC-2 type transport system permease protein